MTVEERMRLLTVILAVTWQFIFIHDISAQVFFSNYTQANSGLVGDNVQTVALDLSGNLWFGTTVGVSEFDGSVWTTYTDADGLVNIDVRDIAAAPSGVLWFATGGGVSKFDGAVWTSYTSADGLTYDDVLCVTIDGGGNVWFGTKRQAQNGGVSKFDGSTWTTYKTQNSNLVHNTVNDLCSDNSGSMWFCTEGGVSKFDGAVWTTYTSQNSNLPGNKVNSVIVDANGDLWFGTDSGVGRFDGTTWTTYTSQNSDLPNNKVNCVAADSSSNIWVGSVGGVSKFDGVVWINYTSVEGLTDDDIKAICIDRIEDKWFCTAVGVNKYKHYLDLTSVMQEDSTVEVTDLEYTFQFTTNRPLFSSNEIVFSFSSGYSLTSPSVNQAASSTLGAMPLVETFSADQVVLNIPGNIPAGNFSLVMTGINNPLSAQRADTVKVVMRKDSAGDTLLYEDYSADAFNIVGRLTLALADRPVNTNGLSRLAGIGGTGIELANFKLTAAGEHAVVTSMQIVPELVRLNAANVSNFDIYLDSNNNGYVDPGESSVAAAPVDDNGSGNPVDIAVLDTVYSTSSKNYIVTADFQNTIIIGDSIKIDISFASAIADTGIISGSATTKVGDSIAGYQHTTDDLTTNIASVVLSNPGINDTGTVMIYFSTAQGLNVTGDELVVIFPAAFDVSNISMNANTVTQSGIDPVINISESSGNVVVLDVASPENYGSHLLIFDNVINPSIVRNDYTVNISTRLDNNTDVDLIDQAPASFSVVGKLYLADANVPVTQNNLKDLYKTGGTDIPVSSFKLTAEGEDIGISQIGVIPHFTGITEDEFIGINLFGDINGNGVIDQEDTLVSSGAGGGYEAGIPAYLSLTGYYTVTDVATNFIVSVDLSENIGVLDSLRIDTGEASYISGTGSITSSQPVKSGNAITGNYHVVEGFELVAPRDTTVVEGKELVLNLTYKKTVDGFPVYRAGNIPNRAGFSPRNGVFTWTPDFSQAGTYSIQFFGNIDTYNDDKYVTIIAVDPDYLTQLVEPDTTYADKDTGVHVRAGNDGIYTKHSVFIPAGTLPSQRYIALKGADFPVSRLEEHPSSFQAVVTGSENGFSFIDSVYLTVEYKEFEVKVDDSKMRIHEWDEARGRWKLILSPQTVNDEAHTVTAKIKHFSSYCVIEMSDTTGTTMISPGWNMVAVPFIPDQVRDPVSLFGDDISQFRYEERNSNIYCYNEAINDWEIPPAIETGRGYILFGFHDKRIDAEGLFETSDITHTLKNTAGNGWNLIGNPYLEQIDFEQDIILGAGIDPAYYYWDGAQYLYYPGGGLTSVIDPWQGFFVHTNNNGAQLDIRYPVLGKHTSTVAQKIAWRMQIRAETGEIADTHNYIGVSESASIRFDGLDKYELVPLGENFISLFFPHDDWNYNPANYTQDIRPLITGPVSWIFEVVTNSASDDVTLKWDMPALLNPDYDVLLDTPFDERINMRKTAEYRFNITPRMQKAQYPDEQILGNPVDFSVLYKQGSLNRETFTITVGKGLLNDDPVVPAEFYLNQNYPNPFNQSTIIEFGLPEANNVHLTIYNSLGQQVRNLVNDHKEPGIYKIAWDGRNDVGVNVASGVYIYRITAENFTRIRKLLLLR